MCEWIFLRLAAYRTPDVLGLVHEMCFISPQLRLAEFLASLFVTVV